MRQYVVPVLGFVIAQSEVKSEFCGVVWDMRHRGADGRYSPLDTDRTASSHLDWAWLGIALGVDFADNELLPHGRYGTRFKAELPLVTVISPHMFLPGAGYAAVAAQVELGLYAAHTCCLGGTNSAPLAYSAPVRPAGFDPAPRRPGKAAAHQ